MINIAICDNDLNDIKKLEYILKIISAKNNININIEKFNHGKELMRVYKNDVAKYNVIFLEVDLDDINGIDVAKHIIKRDKFVKFIILSRTKKYVFEGYEILAINYLLKPGMRDSIEKELFRALKIDDNKENFYEISKKGIKKLIEINSIYYFEVNHRKINIFMGDWQVDYYEKLENIEKKLSERGFVRCHRSYIVNLSKINEIIKNELILINGNILPIGRKYKNNLIKTLNYYRNLRSEISL